MPPRKSADEPNPAKKPARPRNTPKYVRNLYGSPASLRLGDGTRFELRPRGQRGDLAPLTKDQESDGKLHLNVGVLVEVISEAEAKKIISAQTTNQQAYHPALAVLRDQLGNEYAQDDVPVSENPQTTGETVAYLENGEIVTERVPGKGQQMVRQPRSVGPRIAKGVLGGDDEFAELLGADDAARNGSSLEDVLGGFDVER